VNTILVLIAVLAAWSAGFHQGRRGKVKTVEVIPEGFVHRSHITDLSHYDEQGRYVWWSS
jgi:hypothetical protein